MPTTQSPHSYIDELIEIYKKPAYSLLSKSKFLSKVKSSHPHIPTKEARDFIEKQSFQETYTKQKFKGYYKIVAPPKTFQIDIFFMDKYAKQNKFKAFLLFVDILSRKMYVEPLPDRTIQSVKTGIGHILNLTGKIKGVESDDEFNKKELIDLFKSKGLSFSSTVSKEEHLSKGNKLGIVDAATRTIKRLINKYVDMTDNPKFINKLGDLVYIYNTTPHSSLGNLTPDEVWNDPKKQTSILNDGVTHNAKLNKSINLDIGSFVRKSLDKSKFEKEKQNFSKTVYCVYSKVGYKYQLIDENGMVDERLYKYSELLPTKVGGWSLVDALNKHSGKKSSTKVVAPSKVEITEKEYKRAKQIVKRLRDEGVDVDNSILTVRKAKRTLKPEDLTLSKRPATRTQVLEEGSIADRVKRRR
jgi:hypothetical protein